MSRRSVPAVAAKGSLATIFQSHDLKYCITCRWLAYLRLHHGARSFHSRSSRECPRLQALVLPPRPKKSTSLIPQIVLFTRPSILIYDEHAIDLYQLICARYLTAVKGAENKRHNAQQSKISSRPTSRADQAGLPTKRPVLICNRCKCLISRWWAHQGSNLGPAD
jgi:hypothetical protein